MKRSFFFSLVGFASHIVMILPHQSKARMQTLGFYSLYKDQYLHLGGVNPRIVPVVFCCHMSGCTPQLRVADARTRIILNLTRTFPIKRSTVKRTTSSSRESRTSRLFLYMWIWHGVEMPCSMSAADSVLTHNGECSARASRVSEPQPFFTATQAVV